MNKINISLRQERKMDRICKTQQERIIRIKLGSQGQKISQHIRDKQLKRIA
jgi:hypothetical protein